MLKLLVLSEISRMVFLSKNLPSQMRTVRKNKVLTKGGRIESSPTIYDTMVPCDDSLVNTISN